MSFLNATQAMNFQFMTPRSYEWQLTERVGFGQTGKQNGTFANLLMESLGSVNQQQITADQLSVQAIINPDSVDTHDVTIAAAKAEMSLSITKNVMDRVIQAYREIQNVR